MVWQVSCILLHMPKSICGDISTAGTSGIKQEVFSISSCMEWFVLFQCHVWITKASWAKQRCTSRSHQAPAAAAALFALSCAGGSPTGCLCSGWHSRGWEQCCSTAGTHGHSETRNIESMKGGSEFETLESYIAWGLEISMHCCMCNTESFPL